MHDFEVAKGFNDITILFCKRCGLSYNLVRTNMGDISWCAMSFLDTTGESSDPHALRCSEGNDDHHGGNQ
jgi:hypothetical protein